MRKSAKTGNKFVTPSPLQHFSQLDETNERRTENDLTKCVDNLGLSKKPEMDEINLEFQAMTTAI